LRLVTVKKEAMTFEEFARFHLPALELDEVRFNVHIPVIESARKSFPEGFRYWTLGAPGHYATQSPGWSILLGALDRDECKKLARLTKDEGYPGVMGSGGTADWFMKEAELLGITFGKIIAQRIHALMEFPQYPGADGSARPVTEADTALLFDWIKEFHREALPYEPQPQREEADRRAASGNYFFWMVNGEPVSMAAIVRRTKNAAAIGAVFTPPAYRGRGYAGSITAALCECIFAGGKSAACLYTDLDNPYSNRCYAKIGFRPHCGSTLHLRSL
jgi:RimJ/RimL family protein N-acetyltransferase